jgi:hypothetical protein
VETHRQITALGVKAPPRRRRPRRPSSQALHAGASPFLPSLPRSFRSRLRSLRRGRGGCTRLSLTGYRMGVRRIKTICEPKKLILAQQAPNRLQDRYRWAVGAISSVRKATAAYRAECFALSRRAADCSDLNDSWKACSCRNGRRAATSGIFGFVHRGLARGLPMHPQKGAARSIPQPHPIRIFENRLRRAGAPFFSLFLESPLMIRPSRAFEYFVHPFQ